MFFPNSVAIVFVLPTLVLSLPLRLRRELAQAEPTTALRSYDVPFERRRGTSLTKRNGATGSVGLGDDEDILYTVPIQLGDTVIPVQLDTGSSDLWVLSDACTDPACSGSPNLNRYPADTLNQSGVSVTLNYGDSKTGTFASGPVGTDSASLAGISMSNQQFAAINQSTNPTLEFGAVGIFGLGFPSGSVIQYNVVNQEFNNPATNDDLLLSTPATGPLLSRMAISGGLDQPMFSISLQRDTIETGGGKGVLSVGKLPDGVSDDEMTWVPVRLYTADDGGIAPPNYAPNEIFPYRWEIEIDNVFLDGRVLPQSNIPATGGVNSTKVSALIDTGNSIIRGPSDVVQNILNSISSGASVNGPPPVIACDAAHSLAFQIGGNMFPIDPANFISSGGADACVADRVVSTDPPSQGALFQWSLGDTFLKSTIVAFYYGNLTHPSVDPPKIGFKSIVSRNATELFEQTVSAVENGDGEFLATSQTVATTTQGFVTRVAQTVFAIPTADSTSTSVATTTPTSTSNVVNPIESAGAALAHAADIGAIAPFASIFSGSSTIMPSMWMSSLLIGLVVLFN